MRRFSLFALAPAFAGFLLTSPALALDAYPAALQDKFTSWCTSAQGQPETVCSCALSKSMNEVPSAAISTFLASAGSGALNAAATGVGAQVLNIVLSCATGSGSPSATPSGSMINTLGGALGR